MSTAIKISGRAGRHELINDTYEPMQMMHKNKPCWVMRSVQPRYLFHSGKNRWVVSKQIDDGSRCYAFVEDKGSQGDPSSCPGPWTCCDTDGEWRPDPKVQCSAVPVSQDKFTQLRMTLDADMKQYGLIDHTKLKEMWRKLDYNGNNIVSLAEIDKLVVELCAAGTWPAWLNNKPALMRAYKKTTLQDGNGDDWVQKHEFHALLLNLFWFNKLWQVFSMVDSGSDRRIDFNEFKGGLSQLGLQLNDQEAQAEFQKIDGNGGGQVLFVEFCAYIRTRVNPDHDPNFDADIISGEKAGQTIRKHKSQRATHELFVTKKSMSDFDAAETSVKAALQDNAKLHEMWKNLDFNGNNIVSLAEIDKFVVDMYPVLNHKPALMRAYKKTLQTGDGDDWVEKKEFKSLLANLFYFNKIYWLFDQVDGDDRRLTFEEFKRCLAISGAKLSDSEARRDFQTVDKNGGGIILFDEFCQYFTTKSCPESMTALVD